MLPPVHISWTLGQHLAMGWQGVDTQTRGPCAANRFDDSTAVS